MEMRAGLHIKKAFRCWLCLCLMTLATMPAPAQPIRGYTIKDGRMYIMLERKIADPDLHAFIDKYDLDGIGLWQMVKSNKFDSLEKEGWEVMVHNETGYVISKKLEATKQFEFPADKITWGQSANLARFPSVSSK